MQAFTKITSNAIVLNLSDIDTDMIIPAEFLTQTTKSGYGESLFFRLKENDKNFAFNDPKYKSSEILVAGDNFGCGSSREHAVWALTQAGIRVIIAPSFSDIFSNNSAKNGLLLIQLDKNSVEEICTKADDFDCQFTVDLENQKIITADKQYSFEYDPFRKTCLMEGLDDMVYLVNKKDIISKFEQSNKD